MVQIADLNSSIYANTLFAETPSQITINNEDERKKSNDVVKVKNSPVLFNVNLTSRGSFISFSNNLLSNSEHNYRKIEGDFSFRMNCDGICLLHRDDANYLILTEVKSGFGQVRKKAYYQLITSYVKVKSFLATIDTYRQNEYKEIGLVISYPDKTIDNNDDYQLSRNNVLKNLNSITSAYCHSLKKQQQVDMRMKDFGIDKMHVSPNQINQVLRVKYVSAPCEAKTHTIDLDEII